MTATTMPAASAVESVPYCSATTEAASATVKSATSESTSTVKTTSAKESTASKPAAEPRTGSDKDAAVEIARTVISVRRARVRIISIVAVSARRRASHVTRSHSDSYRDLSM
jgi:hypothetical protein